MGFPIAIQVGAALLGAGVSYFGQRRMQKQNARLSREALQFQKEQQARLDAQRAQYEAMEFTNPYANMENPFEDLTVNQQQAQFQAQLGAQQRADILQGLRGAAGTSGVAGLAQSLANQQQRQAQQISASIGQQEARNQLLAAKGAAAADIAERGGEAMVQQAEASRQATLLGVEYGQAAGANAAVQQAYANQMQGNAIGQQMLSDRVGLITSAVGSLAEQGAFDNIGASGSSGATQPQFSMQVPSGTSASGAPLTVPVLTPTGAELNLSQSGNLTNYYNFSNQIPYRF